jgi:signal transduction histidine kinase/ligand-binding sensor domain-containing protein/DNA-binding response OmpR family regulator
MNIKTALYTCLLFIISFSGFAQIYNLPHVKHYTIDDGLPHNIGFGVMQDSKGYMWFGTDDGLVRFNGKTFKTYRSSDGLLSNYVIELAEDKNGRLWIGSWKGGLNYLQNDSIFTPSLDLPMFRISYVGIRGNKMWLSNRKSELYPYTFSGDQWKFGHSKEAKILYLTQDSVPTYDTRVSPDEFKAKKYIKSLDYTHAYISKKQEMLLFGSLPGVWQYHDDGSFTRFCPEIIKQDSIYHMFEDAAGTYWLGGKGKIISIDAHKKVQVFEEGLPKQSIYDIEITSQGIIFFIADYLDLSKRSFYSYNPVTKKTIDLKAQLNLKVLPVAVEVDNEDNAWLTTNGAGVYCISSTPFTNYDKRNGLTNIFVNTVAEDEDGQLYVGTINGLFKYNKGNFTRQKMSKVQASEEITGIIKDQQQRLLINVLQTLRNQSDGSLLRKQQGKFESLPQYPRAVKMYFDSNNRVWAAQDNQVSSRIYDDTKEPIHKGYYLRKKMLVQQIFEYDNKHWVATNKGLFAFSVDAKSDKQNPLSFIDSITVENGLISNFVNTVAVGKDGALWIGTKEGLCKWYKGNVQCFNTSDGLVANSCNRLLIDHHGLLWIGTSKGLSCFNGKRFTNYNHKNGLIASDINCLFLSSSKKLWIGTSKGLSMLDLSQPQASVAPPKLYIEQVEVNGVAQIFDEVLYLEYQSQLKLHFSVPTYAYPEGVRYQYRINGSKWQDISFNFIEYTSLPKGAHLIEIRAKKFNSDWSPITKLEVEVIPPFWDTWWFKVLVSLTFIALVYGIVRWRSGQLEKDKLRLEQVVIQRTFELAQQKEEIASQAEKLKEMDKMKSHFFSNISHELRTPLTLIIGPAEQLLNSSENKTSKTRSKAILNNAQRLLKLINQLLDFSKLESGKLVLQPKAGKFNSFLKNIIYSFELLANQKDITLKLKLHQQDIMHEFDHDKLEKVFFNLLSNALKFTPEGGEVIMEVNQKADIIHIKVSDTGIGIPEPALPFIFDRFYQVDGSQTRVHEGTGIGLSLVKELLELHGGSITAESILHRGTTFFIQLPLQQSNVATTDELSTTTEQSLPVVQPVAVDEDLAAEIAQSEPTDEHTILVVEDNHELRQFISAELTHHYKVIEAADGLEGIKQASSHIPDLIISDLMMPKADGLELLRTLRKKQETSHIPIIILSARASFESKITGLETGGDDYLTKPFSPKELMLRIKNTLDRREKLKEVFMQHMQKPEVAIEPSQVTATSMDETFLTKALDTVEEHLNDTAFDVSAFSKEMGMSQSGLFKKLKALSGLSTTEFIRTIRLKRAASLIQQQSGRIEEIAFQVGFNDVSYFNRCFKKQFGVTPKKYQ